MSTRIAQLWELTIGRLGACPRSSLVQVLAITAVAVLTTNGCASRSVLPDVSEVKVGREDAAKGCVEVGKITGTTKTAKGTAQEALEDLKVEASRRGINYVKVGEYSSLGTTVTGIGYECR